MCIVSFSLIVGACVYVPFTLTMSAVNLMHAGKFVDSLREKNVEVFTLLPADPVVNPAVSVPLFDYFTGKNVIYEPRGGGINIGQDEIEKSSLRFTWECRTPPYYGQNRLPEDDTVIAVISESAKDEVPDYLVRRLAGYRLSGVFETSEGIFRYRTSVRVYSRDAGQ